jgi:hypothetical protein
MRRRQFIAGLAGGAAWPIFANAQPSTVPTIGFLSGSSEPGNQQQIAHSTEASVNKATLKDVISRLFIGGRQTATINCPQWQRTSFDVG